jgi:hypothetical protein
MLIGYITFLNHYLKLSSFFSYLFRILQNGFSGIWIDINKINKEQRLFEKNV